MEEINKEIIQKQLINRIVQEEMNKFKRFQTVLTIIQLLTTIILSFQIIFR